MPKTFGIMEDKMTKEKSSELWIEESGLPSWIKTELRRDTNKDAAMIIPTESNIIKF